MSSDLEWAEGGPRSLRYGDVYFSSVDGLAESRAVFLEGCGLPDAWTGRPRFTVAELGFGTGLNIAALLQLWRRTRPVGAQLSIFSVEAHLLSGEEAARALACWPSLADEAAALLQAWPDRRAGFHRLDMPGWGATFDLYVGDVDAALARWSGPADAWFLDGFAPARNPQMWSDPVLAAVGRLSAPGARAATFTVAGHVRRGLAAAGFQVDKRPGFGAKRERLEARLPVATPERAPPRSAVVIGAGIAGAALVRALDHQGVACTFIEAEALGTGASGNPAALVTPRLDAGFGPAAELHAQAFARALQLYRLGVENAFVAVGALQLGGRSGEADRFMRLAAWEGFAPGDLRPLGAAAVAALLDEPDDGASALLITKALTVWPEEILREWSRHARSLTGRVESLRATEGAWACLDAAGQVLCEAEVVCLAAGAGMEGLAPGLGLQAVRGQVEFTQAVAFSGEAAGWGAYAIPLMGDGVMFGASHVRGDRDTALRPEETAANLAALATRRPGLAARVRALGPGELRSRAAIRMATPDYLPLAGEADRPGVYLLTGLGGRGFTLAPLLADHVAALVVQAPSPLSRDLAHRLRPDRFAANPKPRRPLG